MFTTTVVVQRIPPFADVFDRLWKGQAPLQLVPTRTDAPGTLIPLEVVYASDWDVTFQGRRPPTPGHCQAPTVAQRSLAAEARLADPTGRLTLQMGESDRPMRAVMPQWIRWELRLDPALHESVERAAIGFSGGAFELARRSTRIRGSMPELYGNGGDDGGFYRGQLPFRDFYRAVADGRAELMIESPDLPGGEARAAVGVRTAGDWNISCT